MIATHEAPPAAPPAAPPEAEGDVKWLALLLRQVALMLASAVELRYGLRRRGKE